MKMALTVFRKEMLDSLRDYRTLMVMILIPLLLFPALLMISTRFVVAHERKSWEKTIRLGLDTNGNAEDFRQKLLKREDIRVYEGYRLHEIHVLIQKDSLDGYIEFEPDFDRKMRELAPGRVGVYFRSTEERDIMKKRLLMLLDEYEADLRRDRLRRMHIDETILEVIRLNEWNIATPKERLAGALGGFLPYLFIIFCFMGSMYPAIDLAAGEKERGTLETLLTSPVRKMDILMGKFGVITLTGVFSALVSILGLYIGIRQSRDIPREILDVVVHLLEWRSIGLLLSLLIPLTTFFAGCQLAMSIAAKSFKEAQNMITPLMLVVIIPAFIGLLPGMRLQSGNAWIPVLNVSLATKAIMGDHITFGLFAEVYASLILLAVLGVWSCSVLFDRESLLYASG